MDKYIRDENRMFNVTRLVFYLEHAFDLPLNEFIMLLSGFSRLTLIRFTLLYFISGLDFMTCAAIKNSLDNFYEFGKYFAEMDALPTIPAMPDCDLQLF